MAKSRSKLVSSLKWIGVIIAGLAVLLYLGLPAAVAVFAVLPAHSTVGSPPEDAEEVQLVTDDGVQLSGWYKPPANGAVIILLHGASGSRENVRLYFEMLTRNQYGVLALDLRGHGESGGKTNRLGWQGTSDVGAAVDFLLKRPEVKRIGGLGISMGAEALLGAASQYPDLRAIAADGATRRCTSELLALESERPLVRNFTARVEYAVVQLLSGEQPPSPLLTSMMEAGATRYLFIAAGNNALEVSFNQLFAQSLGSRAELWIVSGVDHTGAYNAYAQEYEDRLIKFFDSSLLD